VVFLLETTLKRRRLGALDKTEKFALVFSVILIGSALFKSNRTAFALRIASDAFIIPFIAYFCTRRLVTSEERLRQLIKAIAYMGLCVLLICVVERLLNAGLYYRLGGPFEQPNAVHVIMSVIFFIALIDLLGVKLDSGNKRLFPNYIRNSILYLAPVAIAMTWARATWLAFLCSITVFVLLNRRFLPRSVTVLAAGIALMIIPLIMVSITTTGLDQIIEERVTGRSRTIYSRFGAWTILLDEYSKAPMLGIGLNNLRDTLDARRISIEGVKSETHAHNSFLTILAEQGTLGLLIYLGIIVSVLQMGRRLNRTGRSSRETVFGALVLAIMVAYLVIALFTTALHLPVIHHVYVYSLVGAIAGVYRRIPVSYTRRVVNTAGKDLNARQRDDHPTSRVFEKATKDILVRNIGRRFLSSTE
jgi:O-antigen ligase